MLLSIDGVVSEALEGDETCVFGKLTGLQTAVFEPVGRWYEAYCTRRNRKQTLSHHSLDSSSSEEEEEEDVEEEEGDEVLLTLDPKEWKHQDHYRVLGIAKLRWKATDDQIKRAYKRKVLKHHPDKRRARGVPVKEGEEDYFTCITRAYETLGNPTKRRSYDSVDPEFDDAIPSTSSSESKEDFYAAFGPVFERNARWSTSKRKRIPMLGDENTPFDEVDNFYSFWYDFDSWREYSWLDEEEKEKGENRDERRWIDKQNKAERQKRKKEEIARIRQLVDNGYNCDPRIIKHREDEKAKKLAVKQAKKDAARARAEEEDRIKREAEEEERKRREKEEEEAKAQAAVVKKEKEAQKKIIKKERKTFRTALKDYDFFAGDDAERVTHMQEVDKLAELLSVTSLQSLNTDLTSGDKERARQSFLQEVKVANERLEKEKQEQLEASQKSAHKGAAQGGVSKVPWPDEEIQALIKAVNLFPAGTAARWETIANYLTQHVEGSKRSAKEVLAKAKDLQKNDQNLREDANRKAFSTFTKESKAAVSADKYDISERYDSVAAQLVAETGSNPAPWTTEEQKLLEQALKTYPATTGDRWDRIADCLPQRSKKDCMKRYKELVEMVRAKKSANIAAAKKK